jgi:hypothetical protein
VAGGLGDVHCRSKNSHLAFNPGWVKNFEASEFVLKALNYYLIRREVGKVALIPG